MRQIGHLPDEAKARTFADYLYVQGIENQVEYQKDAGWAVWVSEEDKIERAGSLLAEFRAHPEDPKYRTEAQGAAKLRAEEQKTQEAYRKRLHTGRHLFRPLTPYGSGPLTFLLIVASVTVFVLSKFATNLEAIHSFFITESREIGLPEIRHGEIWRLFTPMFIHFSVLHIFFNMWWLLDLGSMIEARQSTWLLALLVLVIAACSNLAQYYWGGPVFGGMSGVVYGLLGYVWMRGKFDPGSGLFLHPTTVTFMIIWFVACWLEIVGAIANMAHTAGLVLGVAWGYLSSLRYR